MEEQGWEASALLSRCFRFDEYPQQLVGSAADLVAGDSDDAGVSGPEHLNSRAAA